MAEKGIITGSGEGRSGEEILRQDFENLVQRGWLGEGVTFEQYMGNRQLQTGIVQADEIGNLMSSLPDVKNIGFENKLLAQDLCALARQHRVIGSAVRPFDLLAAPDLLMGLLDELKRRGVDVSDFITDSSSGELPEGGQ